MSILEKIARLHELASRPGTQAEAEAAAAKVQQLLLKHNLEIADIPQVAEKHRVEAKHLPGDGHEWKAKLLGVVAGAHLCRAVRHITPEGTSYTLIGHPHNLVVAERVYAWLIDLVQDSAEAAMPRDNLGWMLMGEAAWVGAFRFGMVDGIARAYQAGRESLNAEDALVPIDAEVESAMREMFTTLEDHYIGGEVDAYAYRMGFGMGQEVNIDAQIEGATDPVLSPGA